MDHFRFSDLSSEEQDWIDAWVDETIEPEDFERLQDRMKESPDLRAVMRQYLAIDDSLRHENGSEAAIAPWVDSESLPSKEEVGGNKIIRFTRAVGPIAAAATLAFLLGSTLMPSRNQVVLDGKLPDSESPSASGFAVIERLFDASWENGESEYREGDMLGNEVFRLKSGLAGIQFFSGAMMTVEGPAEISLKSAWQASCREGAVRMEVPPAARGFKLETPSTEIVDLGTEFGLVVRDGKGHVEVLDGEVSVRHRGGAEQLLKKTDALVLSPGGPATQSAGGRISFPDVSKYGSRSADKQRTGFQRWKTHAEQLARDKRILAYYTFDDTEYAGIIPNLTIPEQRGFDGTVILAEPVSGRWQGMKAALEFRKPGSRVRVNISGEFSAFTFACWTRIDSLDRLYNALFMGDGYENGEPHWQIKNDGRMMFSIMVDDSRPHPKWPNGADRFHHVYFSPPMWNLSMSGQWLHLASVYDPKNRQVSHYVNGKRISREEIAPVFYVETLCIGNGEIGNWGQPFREDPTFAIRNLNGRMDELAIFKAALSDAEIAGLYELSRSDLR